MNRPALAFLLGTLVPLVATAGDSALSRVTTDELRTHVETLAADSFEGREAGRRGGHAAAAYILTELKHLDIRPAGENGTFIQEFGQGYRNILAVIPGSDERLKAEFVVVGAHYDHVGLGTKNNSFGPYGRIHNGADDNASGTAALLELIEAFSRSPERSKRTLLFAFWDAEEKGLLGSAHWVSRPTVPLESVKFAFNFDMLGRLRNRTLEVYGVRTAAGLRRLLSEQNAATDLTLKFDWTQRDDSDHWTFYKRQIPYLMLHTGLHDEYHRPADDANLINVEGLQEATELCRRTVAAVADAPVLAFRSDCTIETNATNEQLSAALAQPGPRLGVRWDAAAGRRREFLITRVQPGSAAAVAGLRVGDELKAIGGVRPMDTDSLRRSVLAADADTTFSVVRDGEPIEMPVRLDGAPVRIGITWRQDDAEPGVVTLRRVIDGSPADEAGLKVADRVLAVDGESFADEPGFRGLFREAGDAPALLVERDGRLFTATVAIGFDLSSGDKRVQSP